MKYYIESTLNILGDETAIRHLMTMAQTTQTDFDLEQLVPITPHIIQIQAQNLDWEEEMQQIGSILQKYWSTDYVYAWIMEQQLNGNPSFIKCALQTLSDAPLHFVEHLSQKFPSLLFVLKSEMEEYWEAKEWYIKDGKMEQAKELFNTSSKWTGVNLGLRKQKIAHADISREIVSNQTLKAQLDLVMAPIYGRENTIIERVKPEDSATQKIHTTLSEFWTTHDFYTAETVKNRFALPPQYAAYLEKYGRINQGKGWRYLKSCASVLADTTYWYDNFSDEKERYRREDKYPMMMINIGSWSDKHWVFMSCDKAHHFGKVYDAYDTDFFDLPRIQQREWPDFFTFLKSKFQ